MNEGDAVLHDETVADNRFFIDSLYGAVPDLVIKPEVLIAQGDWVAAELSFSGTFTEPFTMFGIDPTGEPVFWTEMDFFHFNADGNRILAGLAYDYLKEKDLLTQIGR